MLFHAISQNSSRVGEIYVVVSCWLNWLKTFMINFKDSSLCYEFLRKKILSQLRKRFRLDFCWAYHKFIFYHSGKKFSINFLNLFFRNFYRLSSMMIYSFSSANFLLIQRKSWHLKSVIVFKAFESTEFQKSLNPFDSIVHKYFRKLLRPILFPLTAKPT